MKKFISLCILLIQTPVFSLCSIDIDNSICTVSNPNNSNSLPIFQSSNSGFNINGSKNNFQSEPKNSTLNNPLFLKNDSIMKYNSGCQFGTCVQDLNNKNNQNQ